MRSNSSSIFESSLLCSTSNSGRGFLLLSWLSFWNLRRILITEHCDYLRDLSSDLDKYSYIASDMWHLFCVQRREMVNCNNDPWSVLLISMIFFFPFWCSHKFFFLPLLILSEPITVSFTNQILKMILHFLHLLVHVHLCILQWTSWALQLSHSINKIWQNLLTSDCML